MKWKKIMLNFLIILIIAVLGLFIRKKINEIQYKPYKEHINLLKSGEYYLAYKQLYPLVKDKDRKAMNFISDAYLSGDGIPKDLVKSNIWKNIASAKSFNVGISEYDQFRSFLTRKNYGMASVFLQKSAKKGNKEAIELLKNDKYLQENKLTIDPNWTAYWKAFDYDNLYPFCSEIEECKNGLIVNKSNSDKQ